jgi:hypothetical protein
MGQDAGGEAVSDKTSPLPWICSQRNGTSEILDASGGVVACNETYYPTSVDPADQALIVRAVNAHDALVLASKAALNFIERWRGAPGLDGKPIEEEWLREALKLAGEAK